MRAVVLVVLLGRLRGLVVFKLPREEGDWAKVQGFVFWSGLSTSACLLVLVPVGFAFVVVFSALVRAEDLVGRALVLDAEPVNTGAGCEDFGLARVRPRFGRDEGCWLDSYIGTFNGFDVVRLVGFETLTNLSMAPFCSPPLAAGFFAVALVVGRFAGFCRDAS